MPCFQQWRQSAPISWLINLMNLGINVATEGYPDEIAVRSLCRTVGLGIATIYNLRGKSTLDKNLRGYNNAAKSWYWFVLRDLDHDAECGAALRHQLIPSPSQFMHLRIVVREIESWLLADSARFAQFLGVARSKFPEDPESLDYPKREFIRLASGSSKRNIRDDMVPRPGSGAAQGPGYGARLAEFIESHWRPDVAAQSSDSLRRCLGRLTEWVADV